MLTSLISGSKSAWMANACSIFLGFILNIASVETAEMVFK